MTEQNVNVPLLRKAVEWAEAEAAKPAALSQWEQSLYFLDAAHVEGLEGRSSECGSCYCIAGYVVSTEVSDADIAQMSTSEIPEAAAKALGLARDEAGDLFRGTNAIEDVRRIAESLAGERL